MTNTPFGLKGSARFQPRAAVTGFTQPAAVIPAAPRTDWLDGAVAFLFSPKGRVSRLAYRLSRFGYLAVYFGLYRLGHPIRLDLHALATTHTTEAGALFYVLAECLALALAFGVVFASGVMLTIKRWHDLDKSGWWALVGFVPILGTAGQLIAFAFMRGTPGPNRFGRAPR